MANTIDNTRSSGLLPYALMPALLVVWWVLFPVRQPDYALYLQPWLNAIRESEGLDVFATGFTNYTGAYVTILWLFERLDALSGDALGDLAVIKFAALAGTLLCAAGGYCVLRALNSTRRSAIFASIGLMLLPEVLLNGVAWGQADTLYAAMLLFTLAAMVRERGLLAGLCFAFAVSIKLQAIWFAPLMAGWLLKRPRMILPAISFVPIAYLSVNLLYLIAGRPIRDVMLIYFEQFGAFDRLAMNAPNFWSLIDPIMVAKDLSAYYPPLALLGSALAMAAACWIMWRTYYLPEQSGGPLLYWATIATLSMPYLLPKMHERFFLAGGLLAYLLAVTDRRYILSAALVQSATALAYAQYHDTFGLLALFGKALTGPLSVVLMTIALGQLLRLKP